MVCVYHHLLTFSSIALDVSNVSPWDLDSKGVPPRDVSGENQDILPLKREFSKGSSLPSVRLPYEVWGDDDPLPELDLQGVGVGGRWVVSFFLCSISGWERHVPQDLNCAGICDDLNTECW